MDFFSLFWKKDRNPTELAETGTSHAAPGVVNIRKDTGMRSNHARPKRRDCQSSRETVLKIDAIESEMSSEFATPRSTRSDKGNNQTPSAPIRHHDHLIVSIQQQFPALAACGNTTELLLEDQCGVGPGLLPASDVPALLEEAAILYASRQDEAVEQLLRSAISENATNSCPRDVWLMLFDLYLFLGRLQEFEQLAIDYAHAFETSPPAWADLGATEQQQSADIPGVLAFSGKLDATIRMQLAQLDSLSQHFRTIRLEFLRVTEVDPAGCGLLITALQALQKSGHDLILMGAYELVLKLRAVVKPGRRDDTEDAWLLLLEMLRLLNRENDFEDVGLEYCVTFEVSPPSFVMPKNCVTTASAARHGNNVVNGFLMPRFIEGGLEPLISSLTAYTEKSDAVIVDCSQLARVDLNAAGGLLRALEPLSFIGKSIEFHHVNRLVAELFQVTGLKDVVRVFPRKN